MPLLGAKSTEAGEMGPVGEVIEMWLSKDLLERRKDRRNAARIYHQLGEEHGCKGGERTVGEYVDLCNGDLGVGGTEKFIELDHPPGYGQVDSAKMWVLGWGIA